MTDFRRSLLWVVFGLSLVMLWDRWQVHNGNAPLFFAAPTVQQTDQGASDTKAVPAGTPGVVPVQAVGPASERTKVESDLFELTFDSEGGNIVGAVLRQVPQHTGDHASLDQPFVLLRKDSEHIYVAQSGIAGLEAPNHTTPMQLLPGQRSLAAGEDQLKVTYASAVVGGLQLTKTYTLHRGSYVVDVTHELVNRGDAPLSAKLYTQLVRDDQTGESATPFYNTFTGPAVYTQEQKFQKVGFEDIAKGKADYVAQSSDGYIAMVQHYFASAWLLPDGLARENSAVETQKQPKPLYAVRSIVDLGEIAPGQSKQVDARLFMGPQEERVLENIAPGLELVKDYGWVTVLAKPLYWLLEQIHHLAGNWGWSIVLLVVLIKAAFYWLNASAYRSMAKMKALNPRITEMRARLKDNPQQMQQEMMRIYREEKVNPLGGCLPIMIQIPVFIALYWVLLSSVEMRNAPWALWIADLSSKDPYYVLPVIMTLTTLLQTALNPLPPDPLQAKLMWLMPLAFAVMFFQFPAGLVLYWITNNTLTIVQQWYINHSMGVKLKINLPKFRS